MASNKPKVIQRPPRYRGDTFAVTYLFKPKTPGYDWSNAVIDCSLTSSLNPNDNTGAAATRIGVTPSINSDNSAQYTFKLTDLEARSLTPGQTYYDQCQIRTGGTASRGTMVTGKRTIFQDYVI